jgi:hypothetical protein
MTLMRGNGVRAAAKHQSDVRAEPQPDRVCLDVFNFPDRRQWHVFGKGMAANR